MTRQQAMHSKVQHNSLKMEQRLNKMAKYIEEKKWIPPPENKNVTFHEEEIPPPKVEKQKSKKRKKAKVQIVDSENV